MTPVKAIRKKCLDCCCGQVKEVKICPCLDCSLYPFRLGKNPNRAGMGRNTEKAITSKKPWANPPIYSKERIVELYRLLKYEKTNWNKNLWTMW